MNYVLRPSLQHIATVKIVAALWNPDEIVVAFAEVGYPFYSSFGEDIDLWMQVENKVIEKVAALPLAEALKKTVVTFIPPMRLKIQAWWAQYNQETGRVPKRLFWTPQGTVDRERTAVVSVRNEHLELEKRYKLACVFCLEDEIPALWRRLPEEWKKDLLCYDDRVISEINSQTFLTVFWSCKMKGEVTKLDDPVKMLKRAVFSCNRAASEYFLEKLSPDEKNAVLVECAVCAIRLCCSADCNEDLICFLLSQMSQDQQDRVLEQENYALLKHFLNWPWQSLFVETARRVLGVIGQQVGYEQEYQKMLRRLTGRIHRGYKEHKYCELLREFWRMSSVHCKNYFLDNEAVFVFIDMFVTNEEGSVKLLLNQATAAQLERLIFFRERHGNTILIYKETKDFLRFLVHERIISEQVIANCKTNISTHFPSQRDEEEKAKFLLILQDLVPEKSQKSVE